jgi:hypothetical protein
MNFEKSSIMQFIRKQSNIKQEIQSTAKMVENVANLISEMNQLFIKFLRTYEFENWDDIEMCDISRICRLRSGIEFLPELLQDIKIKKVSLKRKENKFEIRNFSDFGKLLRSDQSLKSFDEKLRCLFNVGEYEIEESIFPFGIDFQKHWWWVSKSSGLLTY